jgi:hypothetical protein
MLSFVEKFAACCGTLKFVTFMFPRGNGTYPEPMNSFYARSFLNYLVRLCFTVKREKLLPVLS